MDLPYIVLVVVVAIFTLTAMIWDLKTRKLPNWLNISAFVLALVFHGVNGGWNGILSSLAGFGVGFGILLVLWLIGGGGAGDVKFMGALGAWLGVTLTLVVFFGSAVVAVIGLLGIFTWRMATGASTSSKDKTQQFENARQLIPYAVPVTLATWCVLALKLFAPQ